MSSSRTRTVRFGLDDEPGSSTPTLRLAADVKSSEPYIGPIEDGIPVPPRMGKQHSSAALAIQRLGVGQSVLFRNIEIKRLYGHAKTARVKGFGKAYAVRYRPEENGIRVWREE